MSVAGWLLDLVQQIKDMVRVGAGLQGNGAIGKSLDLLGLSLSSSFRAQRIREGEQDLQAARMIRAQERVRSAISATSLPLQDGESGDNEGRLCSRTSDSNMKVVIRESPQMRQCPRLYSWDYFRGIK